MDLRNFLQNPKEHKHGYTVHLLPLEKSWFPLSLSHMESLRPEPVCLELASCGLAEQHEFFVFYTISRCASRTYISEEMDLNLATRPARVARFKKNKKNNSLDVMEI